MKLMVIKDGTVKTNMTGVSDSLVTTAMGGNYTNKHLPPNFEI